MMVRRVRMTTIVMEMIQTELGREEGGRMGEMVEDVRVRGREKDENVPPSLSTDTLTLYSSPGLRLCSF